MSKIKIHFLACSGNVNGELLDLLARQTPKCSGEWGNIKGVHDPKDADFFIAWGVPPNKMLAPHRTIFLEIEPPHRSNYFCKEHPVRERVLYSKRMQNFPAHWFLDKTYDELSNITVPPKTKKMSCILSKKLIEYGRILRVKFAAEFCRRHSDDMDMYGTASSLPDFAGIEVGKVSHSLFKDSALTDYKYHMNMENGQSLNYFSEKFTDGLLMWCTPVYWGCPNIAEMFPENSFIPFDVTDLNETGRIADLVNSDFYEKNIDALKEARHLLLNRYNVWPTLDRMFKKL